MKSLKDEIRSRAINKAWAGQFRFKGQPWEQVFELVWTQIENQSRRQVWYQILDDLRKKSTTNE